MHWFVLSTLFWVSTYGPYASEPDCQAAMDSAPWYVTGSCVPVPPAADDHDHTH